MTQKLISLTIHDRTGVIFDGEVRAISAINSRGMFDVLPIHSNFISVLRKKVILHKTDGSKLEIHLDSGVLRVLLGKVVVYLGLK